MIKDLDWKAGGSVGKRDLFDDGNPKPVDEHHRW